MTRTYLTPEDYFIDAEMLEQKGHTIIGRLIKGDQIIVEYAG